MVRSSVLYQLKKTIMGLTGFCAVVVISFLAISGIEKTSIIHGLEMLFAEEYIPQPEVRDPHTTALLPPPQVVEEEPPPPRVVVQDAVYYIAYRGYDTTVYVQFEEQQLRFHIAEDVYGLYAMDAVYSIIEMFDLFNESFDAGPLSDYYIVSEPGNILYRQIYYNIEPVAGFFASLYFNHSARYPLPWWLCVGLEAYLTNCSNASYIDNLALVLQPGAGASPFGDSWFVSSLRPRNPLAEMSDIAYSIIRAWSQSEILYDQIRLAQTDAQAFASSISEFIAELTEINTTPPLQVLYRFSDFIVATEYGRYIFVTYDYEWNWPRVESFVVYMESAIEFIREYFHITNTDSIRVTLYPFGVINVPENIAEMAYAFGWDAPEVNFVTNDEIILASTSRFGTWAISHEVAHIMLFREFPGYRPHTLMLEGMAILGELLFRDTFEGHRNYRFSVPMVSNINTLARSSAGHILPLLYNENSFGREVWTYDEAGSFFLYLYNNFGIEPLLGLYQSNNNNKQEIAYELFGAELEYLMNSWRDFLWPGGEPEGWW